MNKYMLNCVKLFRYGVTIKSNFSNKKVLLCDRKRHTAHRIVSTPVPAWGYPRDGRGTLLVGTGVPHSWDWDIPPGWDWGTPQVRLGYLCEMTWDQKSNKENGTRVPPGKDLGKNLGLGCPPPCGQRDTCENSAFPSLQMRAVISIWETEMQFRNKGMTGACWCKSQRFLVEESSTTTQT